MRVPVPALIDYIEVGHSLQEFLDDFSTVTRQLAAATLEQAKDHLIADALLLDECVPRALGKELVGHDARTVAEAG